MAIRTILTLLLGLTILIDFAIPQTAQSPSVFLQRYEEFNRVRKVKLGEIVSQGDLDKFLTWQSESIASLLQYAPLPSQRTPDELVPIANLHQMRSEHKQAVVLYEERLATAPDDLNAALGWVRSQLELGNISEAARQFENQKSRIPSAEFLPLAMRVAQALSDSGDHSKAATLLLEIQKRSIPEGALAPLIELMADNHLAAGEKAKAVDLLQAHLVAAGGREPTTRSLREKLEQVRLIGEPAPPFTAAHWLGTPMSSGAWTGKVILLDFWAPWCDPCRQSLPRLKQLHDRYRDAGFEIVGLTTWYGNFFDGERRVPNVPRERELQLLSEYVTAHAVPWPTAVIADQAAHKAYHASNIPFVVLIDRTGRIRFVEVGFNPHSTRLEQQIRTLLKP